MPVTRFFRRLGDWFSLDTRSLACARTLLGLAIFVDILVRLTDVEAHYSDVGILPRRDFLGGMSFPWTWSLHFANGSVGFAAFMLVSHALCALGMALGWRTRLTTALTALLTVSLHNRNWYVNNGGDDMLRALLWIAAFLPWGEICSVDQWRRGDGGRTPRLHHGVWVIAWFLQVFCVYFLSYLLKSSPIWHTEFSALYYASHLDVFATAAGRILREFPTVMGMGTAFTLGLEGGGPLVLVLGWALPRRGWPAMRVALVLLFWCLHWGIIITMKIGLFPWYALAMWTAFLPGEFWDKVEALWPVSVKGLRGVWAKFAGTPTTATGGGRPHPVLRWGSRALGVFFCLVVLNWNISTLPGHGSGHFWTASARWMHLYQTWNMFAPFPKRENLWVEIPAELEDGSTLELLSGETDVHASKAARFSDDIPNEHWRKLLMNTADNPRLAELMAASWCRRWNRPPHRGGRSPRLRRLHIVAHWRLIQPGYTQAPAQKRVVWRHVCLDPLPEGLPPVPWE